MPLHSLGYRPPGSTVRRILRQLQARGHHLRVKNLAVYLPNKKPEQKPYPYSRISFSTDLGLKGGGNKPERSVMRMIKFYDNFFSQYPATSILSFNIPKFHKIHSKSLFFQNDRTKWSSFVLCAVKNPPILPSVTFPDTSSILIADSSPEPNG